MKNKYLLCSLICLVSIFAFAQSKTTASKQTQFILIVRSKTDPQASPEMIQTNIKHWQEFMGGLGKAGILAGGYRPSGEGETLSGANKMEKKGSYVANDEQVSSFLIINAGDMAKAKEIAAKCPVFELQGSVEIRPIQNTAN